MRRVGISRGTKGLRRGALQRNANKSRKAAAAGGPPEIRLPKPVRRPSFPPGVREGVLERAGHCCDMCGQALSKNAWECHHRRLRSQGGKDEPANLLALHDSCHSRAHRNRTWARIHGYIVHRGTDPAARPVWRHGRVWQLPTDSGWVDCDPPTDAPTEKAAA